MYEVSKTCVKSKVKHQLVQGVKTNDKLQSMTRSIETIHVLLPALKWRCGETRLNKNVFCTRSNQCQEPCYHDAGMDATDTVINVTNIGRVSRSRSQAGAGACKDAICQLYVSGPGHATD